MPGDTKYQSEGRSDLRGFIWSFALIALIQTGTLIWFLSSEHTERVQLSSEMSVIKPQHEELWFVYQHQERAGK